jgi:serine/threonine-protein kinase RsbW
LAIEVNLTLCLPRDTQTVPLVRHLIGTALTEACANVVDHSQVEDEYEVRVAVSRDRCEIRVIDAGHGFDFNSLGDESDPTGERGRGVQLMRALVDSIRFESEPEAGTIVHLVKMLDFDPGAPTICG